MSRKNFWRVTQGAITILLLFFLFRNFRWSRFWELYRNLPFWFYALSLAVVFSGQLLYTLKWNLILRAMESEVPYRRLVRHYLIATFFNNFLPSAIGGDTSKVYYLGRQEGYFRVGASVIMDRFLGFFSMSTLAAGLSWTLPISSPAFSAGRNVLTVVMAVSMCLLALANFVSLSFLFRRIGAGEGRLAKLVQRVRQTLGDVRKVCSKWFIILGIMAIVLCYYSLAASLYSIFIFISTGASVSYVGILAILFVIAVLSNIPITINGIGLREQLHYLFFAYLGVSKEVSVGISLFIFFNFLIVSLVGLFLWLRMNARKPENFPPQKNLLKKPL